MTDPEIWYAIHDIWDKLRELELKINELSK